jgi:DNA-binding phage protein
MVMTHVGRKAGVVRQTVVEAVNDDGSPEGLHAIAQVIRGMEFRP